MKTEIIYSVSVCQWGKTYKCKCMSMRWFRGQGCKDKVPKTSGGRRTPVRHTIPLGIVIFLAFKRHSQAPMHLKRHSQTLMYFKIHSQTHSVFRFFSCLHLFLLSLIVQLENAGPKALGASVGHFRFIRTRVTRLAKLH